MSDKRVYHTFARTLPPASKVSKSVVALLRAFGWGSFVVVAGKQPAWSTGVKDAIEVRVPGCQFRCCNREFESPKTEPLVSYCELENPFGSERQCRRGASVAPGAVA